MRYGRRLPVFVLMAGCLLHSAVAAAQPRAASFANVRFGADPAVVARAMESMKGSKLSLLAGTADPAFPFDQRFEGELRGTRVLVSALYDPGRRLEKVLVSFLTLDEDCVPLFRTLKEELRRRYGKPFVDLERWDYPYDKGGHAGQEHFAIRIGLGQLIAAWDREHAGKGEGAVSLMTSENVVVRLAFESPRWAAESERRQKLLPSETNAVPAEDASRAPHDAGRSSGVM